MKAFFKARTSLEIGFILASVLVVSLSACGPKIDNAPEAPLTPIQAGEPPLSDDFLEKPVEEFPARSLGVQIIKGLESEVSALPEKHLLQEGRFVTEEDLLPERLFCELTTTSLSSLREGSLIVFDKIQFSENSALLTLFSKEAGVQMKCQNPPSEKKSILIRNLRQTLWNFAVIVPLGADTECCEIWGL